VPNKQQLIDTIANGDDNISNRLVLKDNGMFELLPFETGQDVINFERQDYVTKWETFDSGSGYVGKDASEDKDFIDEIFDWALKAWNKHEETGRTKIPNPYI